MCPRNNRLSTPDLMSVPDERQVMRAKALGMRYRRDPNDVELQQEILDEIKQYSFFHSMTLGSGVHIAGVPWADRFIQQFQDCVERIALDGKRVMDVGARDGAMSMHCLARGAAEVVAVDNDLSTGLVNFVLPFLDEKRLIPIHDNLYNLSSEKLGQFDVVLLPGVLYHLNQPYRALHQMWEMLKTDGILYLETAVICEFEDLPVMLCAPYELSLFEGTSPTFFNLAGLRSALRLLGFHNVELLSVFERQQHTVSTRFPSFASRFPDMKKLHTERVVLICQKREHVMHGDYFDDVHTIHTNKNK